MIGKAGWYSFNMFEGQGKIENSLARVIKKECGTLSSHAA
jgi:hypothetical protein